MAKANYSFEKRKREQEKKAEKAAKAARKAQNKALGIVEDDGVPTEVLTGPNTGFLDEEPDATADAPASTPPDASKS
jgi:hypothetical protein